MGSSADSADFRIQVEAITAVRHDGRNAAVVIARLRLAPDPLFSPN
jgi:hypothetical protein